MNEAEKLKKTRTERPDKAAFSAFIGTFLLIAGVCFGVWAFWTFQKYRHASDYAEYLRQNPNALVNGKYDQNEIIRSNQNSADHDQLEAIWTGAVGLILSSGAMLLFVRASRIYRRIKRNEYEEIDWRSLEKPAQQIEVLYGRTFKVAAIVFYGFFGGLTLLAILTNLKGGIRLPMIVIGLFNSTLIGVMYYLLNNGKKRSIKFFDPSGITRGDGQHFLWSDFRGKISRVGRNRYGGTYNWRTELVFSSGGVVWVIPQRIKNYEEVFKFIDDLPQATLKDC